MEPWHNISIISRHAVTLLVLPVLVCAATGLPHGRFIAADGALTPEVQPDVGADHPSQLLQGRGQSFVELSSRGDMVRREVGLTFQAEPPVYGRNDILQDGPVTVVNPAKGESEVVQLEELTEECMSYGTPTAECMEKFGSYGIRKMFTETFPNLRKLGYLRPGWMSHPEVQTKKLFELTLPGTLNSGSYAIVGEDNHVAATQPYGIISQNLDFYQQLELGVRLFDIRVAFNHQSNLVYISNGALMIPLATALRDIQRFLVEHDREIIILDVHKDENADADRLKPFLEEESSNDRVPGQLAHEAIQCELKHMLATYKVLAKLSGTEFAENPTIGSLGDIGARVIYFWEDQQVLCTSLKECKTTPGWAPADMRAGFPYAFGPPARLGTRVNATGGRSTARMIEPGCSLHSGFFTKDNQPEKLLGKMKSFVQDMRAQAMETWPKCFPASAPLPEIHNPTIMYTLDAFVTPSVEEQKTQADRMRGVKAIYTRGEGFTLKTEAERTNYLLLAWFPRERLTKPNGIMIEYADSGAVGIMRIIEASQGRPDCGWAIYCKESGSCWADTLLGAEDKCVPEAEVLDKLKEHADGKLLPTKYIIYLSLCAAATVFLCFLGKALDHLAHSYIQHLRERPKGAEEAMTKGREEDIISEPDSSLSRPEESPVVAAEPASGGGLPPTDAGLSVPAANLPAPRADDDDAP